VLELPVLELPVLELPVLELPVLELAVLAASGTVAMLDGDCWDAVLWLPPLVAVLPGVVVDPCAADDPVGSSTVWPA
jgi:hypothetical protein